MRLDGLASVPARVRQKDGFPELTRRHKGLRAGAGLKCTFCSVAPQTPIPYLSELKERFTVYPIDDVVKMTSIHAIRLYELLVQWRSTGKREIEIAWLKKTFQIADSYKSISDLKRWVIAPAIEQINLHSPINVDWQQKKTGRSVTHLVFEFSPKKPLKRKTRQTLSREQAKDLARPGESWDDLSKRLGVVIV